MTINGRGPGKMPRRAGFGGGPDSAAGRRLPTLAVEVKLIKKAAIQAGFITALNSRKNWKQRYTCAINEIYAV